MALQFTPFQTHIYSLPFSIMHSAYDSILCHCEKQSEWNKSIKNSFSAFSRKLNLNILQKVFQSLAENSILQAAEISILWQIMSWIYKLFIASRWKFFKKSFNIAFKF